MIISARRLVDNSEHLDGIVDRLVHEDSGDNSPILDEKIPEDLTKHNVFTYVSENPELKAQFDQRYFKGLDNFKKSVSEFDKAPELEEVLKDTSTSDLEKQNLLEKLFDNPLDLELRTTSKYAGTPPFKAKVFSIFEKVVNFGKLEENIRIKILSEPQLKNLLKKINITSKFLNSRTLFDIFIYNIIKDGNTSFNEGFSEIATSKIFKNYCSNIYKFEAKKSIVINRLTDNPRKALELFKLSEREKLAQNNTFGEVFPVGVGKVTSTIDWEPRNVYGTYFKKEWSPKFSSNRKRFFEERSESSSASIKNYLTDYIYNVHPEIIQLFDQAPGHPLGKPQRYLNSFIEFLLKDTSDFCETQHFKETFEYYFLKVFKILVSIIRDLDIITVNNKTIQDDFSFKKKFRTKSFIEIIDQEVLSEVLELRAQTTQYPMVVEPEDWVDGGKFGGTITNSKTGLFSAIRPLSKGASSLDLSKYYSLDSLNKMQKSKYRVNEKALELLKNEKTILKSLNILEVAELVKLRDFSISCDVLKISLLRNPMFESYVTEGSNLIDVTETELKKTERKNPILVG